MPGTVIHLQGRRLIIEFGPNSDPSAENVRKKLHACSRACARILQTGDFDPALQVAADAVAEITGFARVNIYQFQADHSGHVIAETFGWFGSFVSQACDAVTAVHPAPLQTDPPCSDAQLRLKHQVQHPAPVGHRMLRWTNGTSTSTARNVA